MIRSLFSKLFRRNKNNSSECDIKLPGETTNSQIPAVQEFSKQPKLNMKYSNRKNNKSDFDTKVKTITEGLDSVQQRLHIQQILLRTERVNSTEYHDNNSYDQEELRSLNADKRISKISRFALSEEKIEELENENVLLPRDLLTVLKLEIGGGNFGKVFKGVLKLSINRVEEVAVKTLEGSYMSTSSVNSFIKEGLIMKDFKHDNVLSLIGIMIDYDGLPILISPLMAQDVATFIRNEKNHPTVKVLIDFAIQIAQGMAYISSLKYVHRDLAARNCLLALDQVTVKVADFGLSRHVYEKNYSRKRSLLGVPWKWMSLESIMNNISSHETDVWSYGVLMWELMTRGVTPYERLNVSEMIDYLEASNRLPCPSHCPVTLYEIMLKCWHFNPELRPTFNELVEYLKNFILVLEGKDDKQLEEELNINNIVYSKYNVKQFYANMI